MPLLTDLHDAFEAMSGGKDEEFAEGITAAVQDSLESGNTIGTTYAGSCSLGTVAMTVASTASVIDASGSRGDCYDTILDQCKKERKASEDAVKNKDTSYRSSNDDLMDAIADGISAMVTGAEISEVLAGTAVPPVVPPPTVPANGTGVGSFSDPALAALKTAFKAIPLTMGAVPGGNLILATGMATATLVYFAACVANMEGEGPLEGISGAGTMKGNV